MIVHTIHICTGNVHCPGNTYHGGIFQIIFTPGEDECTKDLNYEPFDIMNLCPLNCFGYVCKTYLYDNNCGVQNMLKIH